MIKTKPTLVAKSENTRLIGKIIGKDKGPTIVFFGGIHGNEPAGVVALERVFEELELLALSIKGIIYGIRGNIPGIASGKRYLDHDLNRLWTSLKIRDIRSKKNEEHSFEEKELLQLHDIVSEIINAQTGPIYFIDIHTTSSKTIPFITINDALINRRFSKLFPLPVVLGIEEYLEGPLLSYINEEGYVCLGFESGQHDALEAVENAISFIWVALVSAEIILASETPEIRMHYHKLKAAALGNNYFYEVTKRHFLLNDDHFKMEAGFQSFEKVKKGTLIGRHNRSDIVLQKDSILFMPLYQEQGEDGYFLIRKIPNWALLASTFLRRIRWDALLTILPGVSWTNNRNSLKVNTRVVRFMSKPFFHLFGYRRSTLDRGHIVMRNRERTSKKELYRGTWWFKK